MNVGTKMTALGLMRHIVTLHDAVRDFDARFPPQVRYNPVFDFCKEAPSLKEAIRRACDQRKSNGKMFPMTSCVRLEAKIKLRDALIERSQVIETCDEFDELYDLVRSVRPWGVGETMTYCAATCIGAYTELEPERSLYLHAGPLAGWKRLTGAKGDIFRVPWNQVPEVLRSLTPYRLEDLLCEYRDVLHPGMMR